MKRMKLRSVQERVNELKALAKTLSLDESKGQDKLMLEMLDVLSQMSQSVTKLEQDMLETQEAMEDMSTDLTDIEEVLFGEEEDDCHHFHDHDEDEDDDEDEAFFDYDEDPFQEGEISFDCPHCDHSIVLQTADIDVEKSPVCTACGKPFFIDVTIDEDGD